jgi:hypothetical protein
MLVIETVTDQWVARYRSDIEAVPEMYRSRFNVEEWNGARIIHGRCPTCGTELELTPVGHWLHCIQCLTSCRLLQVEPR